MREPHGLVSWVKMFDGQDRSAVAAQLSIPAPASVFVPLLRGSNHWKTAMLMLPIMGSAVTRALLSA